VKKPISRLLRKIASVFVQLYAWFAAKILECRYQIAQIHALDQRSVRTDEEAVTALRKVWNKKLFPPDCVSAGLCRGGPALFFTHDEAKEVFIGASYDHAADQLIKWYLEERAAKVEPTTKTVTKLNRAQRRAWSSGKGK
jgi:hypothetical protein